MAARICSSVPRGDVIIADPATTFYGLPADTESMFAGPRLRLGAAGAVLGQPVDEVSEGQLAVDSGFGIGSHLSAEKVSATTTPVQRIASLQDTRFDYLCVVEPSVNGNWGSAAITGPSTMIWDCCANSAGRPPVVADLLDRPYSPKLLRHLRFSGLWLAILVGGLG